MTNVVENKLIKVIWKLKKIDQNKVLKSLERAPILANENRLQVEN